MAQATLNGVLLNDGGEPCTVWFDWGRTTAYGMATQYINGLRTGDYFFWTLTGLNDGMAYHYRAVAQNSLMVVYGADMVFVTPEGLRMMTLLPYELGDLLTSQR